MSENPVFKQWESEEKGKLDREKAKINDKKHLQMVEKAQNLNNMHPLKDLKLLRHMQRKETFHKKSSIRVHWKPKFPKNFDSLKNLKSGDCSSYIKSCFKGNHNRYFSNDTALDINFMNSPNHHIFKKRTNFSTVIWENLYDFDAEEDDGSINNLNWIKQENLNKFSKLIYDRLKSVKHQNHNDFTKTDLNLSKPSGQKSIELSLAEKKKKKQEKWKKIAKNIKDYRRNHSLLGEDLNKQPIMHTLADLPCVSKYNPNKPICKAKTLQANYPRNLNYP
ncbi:unnamed protein product [Blepharisma stoltei]|uniref:Uncharacterized protein n=1 Tax=Blepharisma stoltei TaxID=1481888 RepID=A0AAU9JBU5_9CILI|nr:unnamed protein product [Blepharisma stoltei]